LVRERNFNCFPFRFNKTYQSEQERSFRYLVFVKNVKDFEEEERKHTGLDLDVTRFADWTEEEMVQYLHGNQQDIRYGGPRFEGSAKRDGVQRPQQLDWSKAGKVTAVKDQGSEF
uniref:Inhibitor_I29 domain-containing protein n=1 Tax=Nippostrongylus brasiliensis TaxID=27835 RepID=A0A0N4XRK2_NIPBR